MSMTGDDFDLSAALEAELDGTAHATPAQQEQREEASEAEAAAEERARYVREGSRFVREGKDEPKDGKAAPAEAQPLLEAAPKEKRPTWYKDEYGDWTKLPENFRNALREQEKAYAKGIAEHSSKAKSAEAWEPVSKLIEPHVQQLAAMGSTPQQYVTNLIQADSYLRQDPVQAINWLIGQYIGQGWDVRQLADWMDQQGVQAHRTDPIQEELAALKAQVQQLSQLPVQQQREGLNRQIADWSKDKPDFAAVRQHMAALAKLKPEASLDELYAEAQWAHPEIRERILAEREDKRVKELAGKRHAGAQSPRGGMPNGAVRAPKMSLEEEIGSILDGAV